MSFTLICCSDSTAASYMLAPELRDCTVDSTSYALVLGDSVTYMVRHPVAPSLISFLYVILGHWFRLTLPGHAQMIHCVLSVQIYLYTCWIYSLLSIWCIFDWAWVCPPQHELTLCFLSLVFWQTEIWWSPPLSLRSSFYVHNTFWPSCTPSDLIY